MCGLSRELRVLIDVCLASGEERGNDAAAVVGEDPAVGAGDFFNRPCARNSASLQVTAADWHRGAARSPGWAKSSRRTSRLRRPLRVTRSTPVSSRRETERSGSRSHSGWPFHQAQGPELVE